MTSLMGSCVLCVECRMCFGVRGGGGGGEREREREREREGRERYE